MGPDLILLTETWCNENISDSVLAISGYEIQIRTDRLDTANGIGGGLIIYSKNGLEILPCDKSNNFNQYCKFSMKSGTETFYFYLIYRPPPSGQENFDMLCDLIREAEKNSIMVGDFNLPNIDWNSGVAGRRDEKLVEALQDSFMEQMVDFPTHIKGNCLDLLITNIPGKVKEVLDMGRLGKSDHVIIQISVTMAEQRQSGTVESRNWKKADWKNIKDGLRNSDWPRTDDTHTAQEAWTKLRCKLDELVEKFIPKCTFRPRKTEWMSGEILREVRRKRRLWKNAKNGINREEYDQAAKKVKNLIRNAKRNQEKKLATERYQNSKPFYSYVKKKTTTKAAVGPLISKQGEVIRDEEEMAEELNKYFSSVFTREEPDQVPFPEPAARPTRSKLKGVWITTEKVRRKIAELKPNSAAGPDGLHPRLLKECVNEIAPVLAMIYRKSMDSGEVPEEWKQANVVPIFKKGSKSMSANYRPVSLTCVCCKMMESLIKDDLMQHLQRNKLISPSQHGFMKNKSCTTNLLEFLEELTAKADSGKHVDIVYLDFAKAFDKVPTAKLMKKLKVHGVEGRAAAWIQAWLTGRTQRVTIKGKTSGWRRVWSGVPQGSVLGPVLFLIFINDLDSAATEKQTIKKFADDTKVMQVIETAEDAAELQRCLDRLCDWARTWGMAFNESKCHVMHVGLHNPGHVYYMNGVRLEASEKERDVGVTISSSLKPAQQCQKAAQTASAVLSQITRAFHYRDRHVFLSLYQQYVRPHLEFAVAAWAPWTQADIQCLESVQQRAVRAISGLRATTYEEKLRELGIPSLQERRIEIDMVQTFKIVKGIDKVECELWFERADSRRPTRSNTVKHSLVPRRTQHEYRRNFFSSRVVDHWNSLPSEMREARTVSQFKRLYRRYTQAAVAPASTN